MYIEALLQLSAPAVLAAALLAWISYLVAQVFYRLYLSPVAKFPGPKLAAASFW